MIDQDQVFLEAERKAIQEEPRAYPPYEPMKKKLGVLLMSNIKPETVEWLWERRIPLGKVTLIEGDPGIGKSFVTLAIGTAVSLGRGLPEQPGGAPARVLLLSAEDGLADTIRPRLDAMGADCGMILAIARRITLDLPGCLELDQVLMNEKPRLVVIDPLFAYTGATVDIHRANEVRDIMARLAALAARHHCAIVCIRHLTKAGQERSIYRGLGSIDLTAACRSVLLVGADPQ
jgi:putative DNA primase/helicase